MTVFGGRDSNRNGVFIGRERVTIILLKCSEKAPWASQAESPLETNHTDLFILDFQPFQLSEL
jgi:hypothetical protein